MSNIIEIKYNIGQHGNQHHLKYLIIYIINGN